MAQSNATAVANGSSATESSRNRPHHVLFTVWGPEPVDMINAIKKQYPDWTVSFVSIDSTDNFVDVMSLSDLVPDELWNKATILATLFTLPKSVDLVPNLEYIHIFSSGIDHFHTHPILTSSTITMTTSAGIAAPPIAEYVIMTLLSLTNQLPRQLSWQRAHTWGSKTPFLTSIGDWVGKTVGIAGYGSIGRHAARILTAMGVTVYAYTSSVRDTPESKRDTNYCVPGTGDPKGEFPARWFSGRSKEDLHAFLGSGLHALVVSLPLTTHTRGMFGAEEFAVLQSTSPYHPSPIFDAPGTASKPAGAFLINISRGPILDQPALISALKNRVIRGAALDVTDPEPLPEDSELWGLENCIVTPHTSGLGREYGGRGFQVFMENLGRMVGDHEGEDGNGNRGMWNVVRRDKS